MSSATNVNSSSLGHVRIVGAGLIGTSIGLALRKAGIFVTMVDSDKAAQSLAEDLMGQSTEPSEDLKAVDLVLIATPPHAIASVVEQALDKGLDKILDGQNSSNLSLTFMDVASIKSQPLLDIRQTALPRGRFVASHPMAGREIGGAESARADLFQGCIWAYDPHEVEPQSLALALELISICGASPLAISAHEHDRAVALASHLPQAISTLLARQLNGAPDSYLELSGGGLRDTTRIAASSPKLWSEILSSNVEALKPLLIGLRSDLDELINNLESPQFLKQFIEGGNQGRARIPGKHGGLSRSYTQLPVVIEDKPGQLAALFDECAAAEVNIEDLAIEHSPEQFTGLITLSLSSDDAAKLFIHLEAAGWKVHSPR